MDELAHLISVRRCNSFEPSTYVTEGGVPCNNCLGTEVLGKTIFQEQRSEQLVKAQKSIGEVLIAECSTHACAHYWRSGKQSLSQGFRDDCEPTRGMY